MVNVKLYIIKGIINTLIFTKLFAERNFFSSKITILVKKFFTVVGNIYLEILKNQMPN